MKSLELLHLHWQVPAMLVAQHKLHASNRAPTPPEGAGEAMANQVWLTIELTLYVSGTARQELQQQTT